MSKKIIYISLIVGMIYGCSPKESAKEKSSQSFKIAFVYDHMGPNASFNQSLKKGVEKVKKHLNIDMLEVESKKMSDIEPNILAVAEQKYDLIIAGGIFPKSPLEEVARKFPKNKFAIVGATIDLPNVRSVTFREEEGSFLAGYLAGLVGNKFGFVGGTNVPIIRKFECGFFAGVITSNPYAELLPSKFLGTFEDLDKARIAGKYLYGQGADVVYQAAGKAGVGVLRAAKESKKYAIGVDVDQDALYPGYVLTSMVKNGGKVVYDIVKEFKDGKYKPVQVNYGVKEHGVTLTEMKYTKDKIGQKNLMKLSNVSDRLARKEIKAPSTPDDLAKFIKKHKI